MPANLANDEERRVHDFIVRHFLACCSQDAKGTRDEVSILWGPETFNASGLTVRERNYLDIYPYHKWTSTQDLPQFEIGDIFEPTEANMNEGKTSPPGYLTEPDLISLMDANGIGTDATMAEHIRKIKDRGYVVTRPRGRIPRRNGQNEDEQDEEGEAPAERGNSRGGTGRSGGGNSPSVDEFIPTTLGVALVKGYENMGFDTSLSKPFLRKEVR